MAMRFKTLSQLMKNHDDTWLYSGITLEYKTAVQPWFRDWFDERYLCVDSSYQSDDLWQKYFRRLVNLYGERYTELLKKQMFDFDPDVLETFVTTSTGSGSSTDETKTSDTKNFTSENTSDMSRENTGTSTSENTTSGTSSSTSSGSADTTTTNNATGKHTQRDIQSDYPQSNVASSTAGQPESMLWTYASGQVDGIVNHEDNTNGTSNTDTTNKTSGNSSGTSSGSDTVNNTETGTAKAKTTSTDTGTGTSTSNGTTSSQSESTSTRRGSKQELYKSMMDFIKNCNATNWMIDKLDKVFLSTFEVDDCEVML